MRTWKLLPVGISLVLSSALLSAQALGEGVKTIEGEGAGLTIQSAKGSYEHQDVFISDGIWFSVESSSQVEPCIVCTGAAEYPGCHRSIGYETTTYEYVSFPSSGAPGRFDVYDGVTGELIKTVEYDVVPLEYTVSLATGEYSWDYLRYTDRVNPSLVSFDCDEGLQVVYRDTTRWGEEPYPGEQDAPFYDVLEEKYAVRAQEPGTYELRYYVGEDDARALVQRVTFTVEQGEDHEVDPQPPTGLFTHCDVYLSEGIWFSVEPSSDVEPRVECSGAAQHPHCHPSVGFESTTYEYVSFPTSGEPGRFDVYDGNTGDLLKTVEYDVIPMEYEASLTVGEYSWDSLRRTDLVDFSQISFDSDDGLEVVHRRTDSLGGNEAFPGAEDSGYRVEYDEMFAVRAEKPGEYELRYYVGDGDTRVLIQKVTFTVHPKKYTVTYSDGSGGALFSDVQKVVEDGELTPPFEGNLVRDGYTFDGWSPVVAETVTGDVTYMATWREDDRPVYTVTFTDGCGGRAFTDYTTELREGETVYEPEDFYAYREGYEFAGWDSELSSAINSDLTYTAVWVYSADYVVAIDEGPVEIVVSNPGITTMNNGIIWKTTNYELGSVSGIKTLYISSNGITTSTDFYPKEEGFATLYVTDSNGTRVIGSCTILVTPSNKNDIATLEASLDEESFKYNVNGVWPTVTVRDGDKVLQEGVDYYATVDGNYDIGSGTVSIHGHGNYREHVELSFTIEATDINDVEFFGIGDQTYSGVGITPSVKLWQGGSTLSEKTDYELSYENNVDVGMAKVTVMGVGNFEGTRELTFEIIPRDVTVSARSVSKVYGEPDPSLTADVEGLVGSDKIDYELSRELGEGVGTYVISTTGETRQGNYLISYKAAELTVRPADVASATVAGIGDATYTGSAVVPVPTVTLGRRILVEGTDYEVSYADNISVGTAIVTVTGKGNYTGEKVTSFVIVIPFTDVAERTPHAADITWLSDSSISTGWNEKDGTKTFRPTNTVIRQDMAAFLFRLAKLWGLVDDSWQPTGSVTFADVNEKTPHYREIMWLAESGISAGWKKGEAREFRPTNTVVRQDMAAFLRRLQALRDPSVKDWKPTGDSPFRDVTASTPHSEDILWLAESGVSAGWKVGDTKEFRPTNTVIRQDMAAFLHRLDGLG